MDFKTKSKKGLSLSREKEKNPTNKAQYLIECNFKSNTPRTKFSSDVSYIKCKDGTLYLSAIKDYFNNEILSYSTSNNNDINLIKTSYIDLKPSKDAIVNTDQARYILHMNMLNLLNR